MILLGRDGFVLFSVRSASETPPVCVYMRLYKRRAVSRFHRIDGDVAQDVGTLGGDPRTCVRARARERLYNIILYNVNIECVREKKKKLYRKGKAIVCA